MPKASKTLLTHLLFFFSILSPLSATQPNILFVLVDDLGVGDIQALRALNGAPANALRTPGMDKMASEGMILNRHYTAAPVCAPARGSLLTGMHQGHANIRDKQFDRELEDNWNLASSLKALGYRTTAIGKWGLQGGPKEKKGISYDPKSSPDVWPSYPTKRGFDEFYGLVRHRDGHLHYPAHTWSLGDHLPHHKDKKQVWYNDQEVSKGLNLCYSTDLFAAKAKQTIIDHCQEQSKQPFFIYLAQPTPHAALQVPPCPYPKGKGLKGGLQWLGKAGKMINAAEGVVDGYIHPAYAKQDWSNEKKRFATMVTRIDQTMADLLQTLKDLGIAENTLVVLSSDNGPHTENYMEGGVYDPRAFTSYAPFEGIKQDVLEGGWRVPTLAWGPGMVPAGSVNTTPSQFHDWLATFTDLAGSCPPARSDSVSLLPILKATEPIHQHTVYTEFHAKKESPHYMKNHPSLTRMQQQAIYLDGYKGIRNNVKDHQQTFRIYDTLTDPTESEDLTQLPEWDHRYSYFYDLEQRMKDEVLRLRMPHQLAKRAYDNELIAALDHQKLGPTRLYHFQGTWPWVPKFDKNKAHSSEIVNSIGHGHLLRDRNAGLYYEGTINIPKSGRWHFDTNSDQDTVLKIHNCLVVDNKSSKGSLMLEAGVHPFKLSYRRGMTASKLSLTWQGPGVSKQVIPASALKGNL